MTPSQRDTASPEGGERPGLAGPRRGALYGLLAVLLLSVAARAAFASEAPARPQGTTPPPGATGLVAGPGGSGSPSGGEAQTAEPEGFERWLPYVTEGSFFALLGFALGFTSRKVVKIALLFLALFFVGLQVLSFAGVTSVDWGRAVSLLNHLVLNLKEDRTISEVLLDKVPTTGAFALGYLLGFRRG